MRKLLSGGAMALAAAWKSPAKWFLKFGQTNEFMVGNRRYRNFLRNAAALDENHGC
jgi:hypothetical protein